MRNQLDILSQLLLLHADLLSLSELKIVFCIVCRVLPLWSSNTSQIHNHLGISVYYVDSFSLDSHSDTYHIFITRAHAVICKTWLRHVEPGPMPNWTFQIGRVGMFSFYGMYTLQTKVVRYLHSSEKSIPLSVYGSHFSIQLHCYTYVRNTCTQQPLVGYTV